MSVNKIIWKVKEFNEIFRKCWILYFYFYFFFSFSLFDSVSWLPYYGSGRCFTRTGLSKRNTPLLYRFPTRTGGKKNIKNQQKRLEYAKIWTLSRTSYLLIFALITHVLICLVVIVLSLQYSFLCNCSNCLLLIKTGEKKDAHVHNVSFGLNVMFQQLSKQV